MQQAGPEVAGPAQGGTTISHRRGPVESTLSWCVDPDTAVKQLRVQVHNHGSHKAHLRVVGVVEWQLGEKRRDRAGYLQAKQEPQGDLADHEHFIRGRLRDNEARQEDADGEACRTDQRYDRRGRGRPLAGKGMVRAQ